MPTTIREITGKRKTWKSSTWPARRGKLQGSQILEVCCLWKAMPHSSSFINFPFVVAVSCTCQYAASVYNKPVKICSFSKTPMKLIVEISFKFWLIRKALKANQIKNWLRTLIDCWLLQNGFTLISTRKSVPKSLWFEQELYLHMNKICMRERTNVQWYMHTKLNPNEKTRKECRYKTKEVGN